MLNVDDDLWASASGRLLDAPTFFFFVFYDVLIAV